MSAANLAPARSACADIHSPRLILRHLDADTLRLGSNGRHAEAGARLGAALPADWLGEQALMALRLADMLADSGYAPWSLRAMLCRHSGRMLGHIGFHSPPAPAYLHELAPGAVELGYTVYAAYRRQGYAAEALAAMLHWARHEHGQQRFVLSIAPHNAPSLALARRFGFAEVGRWHDAQDGDELVLLLEHGA
ncbi:GNAT family N-acetyltransferase [Vogesella facilis]|uniref:GNAT family N-acetyltransferase n=1 Tax=Vogesella facilis TaxID=1655232 RepID=A0ABV7RF71_9NEIS